MNRLALVLRAMLALLALAAFTVAGVQAHDLPARAGTPPGLKDKQGPHSRPDAPQDFVTCTGWHALCSASPNCRIVNGKAECECLRVNEPHIIATSEIQDAAVKQRTLTRCTQGRPCAVDEAPVCEAISRGQYTVNGTRHPWVSTYSYRGWCGILAGGFKVCDPQAPGYSGDVQWAICDAAPCVENPAASDPEKPLRCTCRLQQGAFVGVGSCTGANGGVMSSFPLWAWDFAKNTYPFAMPGYDYVQGACAALQSDPAPGSQQGSPGR